MNSKDYLLKTNKQQIGSLGESLAQKYLKSKGYTILECNWRWRKAEIDIIAKIKDILVFVEVKTRSYNLYGPPETAVTQKKEQLLADAASVYMEEINHTWEIRFDIISITLDNPHDPEIIHFEDAFFPGW